MMKSKLIVMVFVFMMNLSYATEVTDRSPITFTSHGSVMHNSDKTLAIFKKYAKENEADTLIMFATDPVIGVIKYQNLAWLNRDQERPIPFKELSALILVTTAVIAFSAYVEYRGQSSDALRGGGGPAV